MTTPAPKFGDYLRSRRLTLYPDLSKSDFAARCGVDMRTLAMWESSVRPTMRDKALASLAAALHMTTAELLTRYLTETLPVIPKLARGANAAKQKESSRVVSVFTDMPSGIRHAPYLPATTSHVVRVSAAGLRSSETRVELNELGNPINEDLITIIVPSDSKGQFSAVVDGTCMEPDYRDGEIVTFSYDVTQRDGLVVGKDYFFQGRGESNGEGTFKRLVRMTPDALVVAPINQHDHRGEIVLPLPVNAAAAVWVGRAVYPAKAHATAN
jgi:transcriptional regulator with XRE-family HTH domain